MSARTGRRRRRQATMNNAHLSGMGVSRYRQPALRDIGEAIRAEKAKAARMNAANSKAKRK